MFKLFLFFILSIQLFGNIRVATAGNVAFAMNDLVKEFYKETNIKVIPVIGSSGKLTAQIKFNAPFDIFLSANMKYPNYLYKIGKGVKKPKVYAKGRLILFSKNGINKIEELFQQKSIAIANPKTAPYGQATIQYLKNRKLYNRLKNKFVFAPNVSATFSYAMQVTDSGFIARSLLFKFPKLNNSKYFIKLDESKYPPIEQGVLLLNNKKESVKFYNFLFSKKGKQIFRNYGYIIE